MKRSLYQLSLLAIITAALALAPVQSFAQEKKENPGDAKKAENANRALPFRGKVDAVDKSAKTIKVGERVFHVTAETRIMKNEKPATLDDATVGEAVRGSYHKAADGKLNAASLSFGEKPAAPEKVPAEKPAKKQAKGEQGAASQVAE